MSTLDIQEGDYLIVTYYRK